LRDWFFGVQPGVVDTEGNLLEGEASGNLVILDAWPGMMRTLYGDHKRFVDTYFSTYKGKYFTGDGCRRAPEVTIADKGKPASQVINIMDELKESMAKHGGRRSVNPSASASARQRLSNHHAVHRARELVHGKSLIKLSASIKKKPGGLLRAFIACLSGHRLS